jgi:hypothetical protein
VRKVLKHIVGGPLRASDPAAVGDGFLAVAGKRWKVNLGHRPDNCEHTVRTSSLSSIVLGFSSFE